MQPKLLLSFGLLSACSPDYDLVPGPIDVDPADVLECPFVPIPGTPMSVYDCNPVFSGTGESWGSDIRSVGFRTQTVFGHPFYQIWYSATPADATGAGGYGLGYAISSNGTEWEANGANPLITENGGWDRDSMDAVVVLWDDDRSEYVLAYQGYDVSGGTWGLGIYTSPDGVAWNPWAEGKPVLDFTRAIDGVQYCWPLTLNHDDGYVGYLAGRPTDANVCQIYGFAADELETQFDPQSEPVLRAGPAVYDRSGMAGATVVQLDGIWYLFYVGFSDWDLNLTTNVQTAINHQLALATSTDGVTWEKSPDNPLPVALSNGDGQISGVAAQVIGSRIHLWVTDYYADLGAQAVGYYLYEPGATP